VSLIFGTAIIDRLFSKNKFVINTAPAITDTDAIGKVNDKDYIIPLFEWSADFSNFKWWRNPLTQIEKLSRCAIKQAVFFSPL